MSLFVRLAGDLPVFEKAFFRNFVAAIISFGMLVKSRDFKIKKGSLPALIGRAVAGTIGLWCNFYAIDNMNISDASILNKLAPFFSIIFSIFLLKEKAGWRDWLIVIVAFVGALFVVKPTGLSVSMPAAAGVLGGIMAGLAYTLVRVMGRYGERKSMIVFFFSAFSCLASLPFMVFCFQPMTGLQLLFLILAGCAAAGAQFAVTGAYQCAPARDISVYDYSQVLFTALWGLIFLGEFPDQWSIIGYVIIIGAAVVKYLYGRKAQQTKKEDRADLDVDVTKKGE
jgi:drug/metabolite transporter (DMT)-like permease